ncbi:MAG: OpgC domain-containing protein [Planctomycetota bacterium]
MQPISSRDVRLDFFHGLAVFIIFEPHTRSADGLPRALGPSDAAEWFVFCSSVVSALLLVHPYAALGGSVALDLVTDGFDLQLPAEWWSDRPWFFDPFAWQCLFFTGFAFGLAATVLVALFMSNVDPIRKNVAWIGVVLDAHVPLIDKTDFGPARWVHLRAIAHLALIVLDGPRDLLR